MSGPTFAATGLDRLIGYLSPVAGERRIKARARFDRLRRYEAAGHGARTAGWRTHATSATAAIGLDLETLRDRARDLVRNNGFASKAIDVWSSAVIEKGIRPRPIQSATGPRESKHDIERAAALWTLWADSTACDAAGRETFGGIQRLVQREVTEAGECLVRRRTVRDGGPVPLKLQILEPDHIDTRKDEPLKSGARIIQGVEVDRLGARIAYWLFPEHPGDIGFSARGGRFTSVRVPAADVLHVFRSERAGQVRGVSWGAPAILTQRDFDDYIDAELVRVKIASAYVGFVRDIETPDLEVVSAADGADGTVDGAIEFEPGTWEFLPEGKDITFSKPPEVDHLAEYSRVALRQIAAGWGVPYESLTGDLTGISFSGGRLGRLDFRSSVEEWQTLGIIPQLCAPVWKWFANAARFAEVRVPEGVEWSRPPARMIEPSREIRAILDAVRGGLMSLSEAIRRQGMTPERVLEELRDDRQLAESLGLVLTSLPNNSEGQGEATSAPTAKKDAATDERVVEDQGAA